MEGKMILLAVLLGVAIADDHAPLKCYKCMGSMYRMKGNMEWMMSTENNADPRCTKMGYELTMNPPPVEVCEEMPGMVARCTSAQGYYDQEMEGETMQIMFVSRSCSYVAEKEAMMPGCTDNLQDYMPVEPSWMNFRGTGCSCDEHMCNTGEKKEDKESLKCHKCTGSMYRMKGGSEWMMWNDPTADPRCMKMGYEYTMSHPPTVECEEKPGMVAQCNLAQGTYHQEMDGEMMEIMFTSRGCTYVEMDQNPEAGCIGNLPDYMPAQPGWMDFGGWACSCDRHMCNTGDDTATAGASQVTLSMGLLAGVIAAALKW